MRIFDPDRLDRKEQYKLLAGSVVPRPVALVTTLGGQGPNAAPFSFFNVLGTTPPMLMFSVGMKGAIEKDTLRNLRQCPELVIHLVDEANAGQMNLCSAALPYGVSELEMAGLETLPADLVGPPRIASCPVHFECVLERILSFGEVPYSLVIARVVRFHFREDLVDDACHVDLAALKAIGRVTGAGTYVKVTDLFHLPDPALRMASENAKSWTNKLTD